MAFPTEPINNQVYNNHIYKGSGASGRSWVKLNSDISTFDIGDLAIIDQTTKHNLANLENIGDGTHAFELSWSSIKDGATFLYWQSRLSGILPAISFSQPYNVTSAVELNYDFYAHHSVIGTNVKLWLDSDNTEGSYGDTCLYLDFAYGTDVTIAGLVLKIRRII
jgi:hypothetical protein